MTALHLSLFSAILRSKLSGRSSVSSTSAGIGDGPTGCPNGPVLSNGYLLMTVEGVNSSESCINQTYPKIV